MSKTELMSPVKKKPEKKHSHFIDNIINNCIYEKGIK